MDIWSRTEFAGWRLAAGWPEIPIIPILAREKNSCVETRTMTVQRVQVQLYTYTVK